MASRRPPLRLLRAANPAVAAVLRSRAHRLLSGSLLLLTYRGRTSGRSFTIPVMYARDGERLLVVAADAERKVWWRSFAEPAEAVVRLAGAPVAVSGHLLDGAERDTALAAYVGRFPRTASSVANGAAVVAFEPIAR